MVKAEPLIRRALPGEFVLMAKLAVRAWETAVTTDNSNDVDRQALECRFLKELSENADGVLTVTQNDRILGWGARIPYANMISDLWIDLPHQGQGLGRLLLDSLIAQILLDGFNEICIGTHADNKNAIHLYEKVGFRIHWRGMEWSDSLGKEVEKVALRMSV